MELNPIVTAWEHTRCQLSYCGSEFSEIYRYTDLFVVTFQFKYHADGEEFLLF